jgi:hypothetical protein
MTMPEDYRSDPRVQELMKEYPNATKAGTIENRVAQASWQAGHFKGEDVDQLVERVRDELETLPGRDATPSNGGGNSGGNSGGNGRVSGRLSDSEKEIARISGISESSYLESKKELQRQGLLNRYGKGY